MKKYLFVVLLVALVAACGVKEKRSLENETQKVSYIIGNNFGKNLKSEDIKLDLGSFLAGFNDGINEKEALISAADAQKIMAEFQKKLIEAKRKRDAEAEVKNKEEGEKFLKENAKKEGVKVTPSGLQYKIIKEGTGKTPKATDMVTVNYTGKFIDGKVFDSSADRGKPAEFTLNGVIKGWTEGLQLIKEGGKIELYIPDTLAYGKQAPPTIGPNKTLIFEVELLKVGK